MPTVPATITRRGDSVYTPGNTLAAFELALRQVVEPGKYSTLFDRLPEEDVCLVYYRNIPDDPRLACQLRKVEIMNIFLHPYPYHARALKSL